MKKLILILLLLSANITNIFASSSVRQKEKKVTYNTFSQSLVNDKDESSVEDIKPYPEVSLCESESESDKTVVTIHPKNKRLCSIF